MDRCDFKYLVSPESGLSLKQSGTQLNTEDGRESFVIQDGIACLLNYARLDETKKHQMAVFDNMYIQNTSYFREIIFRDIFIKILPLISASYEADRGSFAVAELGGGEGHWARYIHSRLMGANIFVCDLSLKTLCRASPQLKRVLADVTRHIFEKNSLQLVCFWVSLHHLDEKERHEALKQAVAVLGRGGVLMIFEPNDAFFLRRQMYKSRFSADVYPDKKEQAIDFSILSQEINLLGLREAGTYFMNPPYNRAFLKQLKKWFLYFVAVEGLYWMDRLILNPLLGSLFSQKQAKLKKYFSLYGLSIYIKSDRDIIIRAPCIVCGNKNFTPSVNFGSYHLVECQSCGLIFSEDQPDKDKLDKLYSHYYKSWVLESSTEEVSPMKIKTFEGYLRKTRTFASSGGKLLDIGCATGELLEAGRRFGFDAYGVEVSPEGIAKSREKFGQDRILGRGIKGGDFSDDFFDLITLTDVFEHITEPHILLKILSDILKPSGILMIVTPNTSRWIRKIMGKRWPHYKEEHVYYYNPGNITMLLSPHFEVIGIWPASKTLTVNYLNSVIGSYTGNSFLYKALKTVPSFFRRIRFKVNIGEMMVVCKKAQQSGRYVTN